MGRESALIRRFDEALERRLAKRFAEHPHRDLMYRAARGEIDDLKMHGLYLDIDAEGRVTRDPAGVDHDLAEEWIGHARWFVERAERRGIVSEATADSARAIRKTYS